jgi:hypothetical protein
MPKNSSRWFDLLNRLDGVPLTSAVVGGGGTCTAKMFHGKIEIVVTNASEGKMATSTIETPIGFKVVGVKAFKYDSPTEEFSLIVYNGTNVLSDTLTLATNGLVESSTTIGTAFSINAGDDDLIVTMSGTSTGTAIIVLDIVVV